LAAKVLILPGINGSGPRHWQTFWEKAHPEFQRVPERDWEHPVRRDWVAALEAAVRRSGPKTILVAHSLACLQVAHWAAKTRLKVQSALLVAPPDPKRKAFPKTAIGFAPVPKKLRFPSILVASSNDPYGDLTFSRRCAEAWGSRLVSFGPQGHLNSESNLRDWPRGFRLLQVLMKEGSFSSHD
jgi:predicted alpha/beta hydrolase family esterase